MTHRTVLFGMALILAAAGVCHAAPPTSEALSRLASPADVSVFTPEPFSNSPPTALLNAITSRLATSATVHLNMVVLLVEFTNNRANYAVSSPAHFDSLLFSRNVYPTGSLADYLYENSNGRFILGGVVKGWYMMPHTYDYYVMSVAGRGIYPWNTQGLAEDAIKIADPEVNYALFDNDGPDGVPDTFDDDQQVDLILVIHAGSGGESAGSTTSLQSVAWWLNTELPVDGVFAMNFATAPEDGAVGVFGHESLHLLGLPDLYATRGSSFGLGTWSIMAGGWSLNEAKTPAHLDPWCKARLGFITPVPVTSTLDAAVLDPVEQGGAVYRLAAYGSPTSLEYFLVENRENVGFDTYLPGAGILIYHVNEYNATNNVPGRYLVALEQADGLFQLENFYGNPSFGDAGDPYTEATPSGGFGRYSIPSSRNQDGVETGVTVYHIHGPDASLRMTADLRSVKGAIVTIDSLSIVPVTGNGDAFVNAGESFDVRPAITVTGGTVHGVTLELAGADPLGTLPGPVTLGDLATGSYQDVHFTVGTAATFPRDPYPLKMQLKLDYQDELPIRRDLTAGVGETQGITDDFENGFARFFHHPAHANDYDLWSQEATGGSVGPHAWHCGLPMGGFYAHTDAILESPYIILPADAVLRFDQKIEIPWDKFNPVIAGAFVEMSVNGGPWTEITPTRGYDAPFYSIDPELNGHMVFTGSSTGPDFSTAESVTFDLPAPAGSVAVFRFRCFADEVLTKGWGWWIDAVRVESASTPVRLASLAAFDVAGGVRLEWTLAGEAELSGVRVTRAPAGSSDFTRVSDLLPPLPHGEFIDTEPLPGTAAVYRLEAVGRDGRPQRLGQITVAPAAGGAPALELAAHPNPARGQVAFEFSLGAAGPVSLAVFDAAGRPVREIVSARLDAGQHQYEWDGRDATGRAVPAGVYFYRLDAPASTSAPRTRKLVVIR